MEHWACTHFHVSCCISSDEDHSLNHICDPSVRSAFSAAVCLSPSVVVWYMAVPPFFLAPLISRHVTEVMLAFRPDGRVNRRRSFFRKHAGSKLSPVNFLQIMKYLHLNYNNCQDKINSAFVQYKSSWSRFISTQTISKLFNMLGVYRV